MPSPSPELAEVKITPTKAIHSLVANATIRKPQHCIKQAKNTRILWTKTNRKKNNGNRIKNFKYNFKKNRDVSTHLIKNGKNGLINLTINEGKMSANKIAPVDIILQTLSVSESLCESPLCAWIYNRKQKQKQNRFNNFFTFK